MQPFSSSLSIFKLKTGIPSETRDMIVRSNGSDSHQGSLVCLSQVTAKSRTEPWGGNGNTIAPMRGGGGSPLE